MRGEIVSLPYLGIYYRQEEGKDAICMAIVWASLRIHGVKRTRLLSLLFVLTTAIDPTTHREDEKAKPQR